MKRTEYNLILKEMGITQWVLRDVNTEADQVGVETSNPVEHDDISSYDTALNTKQLPNELPLQATPTKDLCSVETLSALREQVVACVSCDLAKTRSQTVFGEGASSADWLFVGEAPGQQEDRQGQPFVGRAGQLLSQMLRALGKTRNEVYIANTLKCRPPNNRDPLPDELKACAPFLEAQIKLIQPKVVVALGKVSAQALLKRNEPLGKLRGKVYQYGEQSTPLIVTYHPAYLLRNPADKSKVWEDLLLAAEQVFA